MSWSIGGFLVKIFRTKVSAPFLAEMVKRFGWSSSSLIIRYVVFFVLRHSIGGWWQESAEQ